MSCQSLSVVGGGKEATGDVGETAAVASCGTFHRSVRFSSESHSSQRGSINELFRRDSPGATSTSVLAPAPAVPALAFDRSIHSRSSILSSLEQSHASTMSQSAPSAFSEPPGDVTPPRPANNSSCRFPRLDECAHFHYERVTLGGISVEIVKDECLDISLVAHSSSSDGDMPSVESGKAEGWVTLKVKSHMLNCRDQEHGIDNLQSSSNPTTNSLESSTDNFEWIVTRSAENFKMLDTMLHRCIYDRKVSGLTDLTATLIPNTIEERLDYECLISDYLHHLSIIADDSINCGPVLNWFQMDNKGHRLLVANEDTNSINTPAVAAAYSVRRYVSQARDEISFEVGDMISIIDMPGPSESIWWRGKRGFRVGFFPHHCVAVIGDKVPRHMTQPPPIVGSVAVSPIKPVLRKHGKLISLFRSFILARPSRRSLKQQGILRERVFGCDLGEHLLNSGRSVPLVLSACAALIEKHGIVDGIYRLSGATSLTQRLRRSFDDDSMAVEPPELLSSPAILHDVHAVASLIKMYFRELPNPLCTYQLYDHFVSAVQGRLAPPAGLEGVETDTISTEPKPDDSVKLKLMKDVVMKLPPPHYRTMSHLMRHLRRMSLMGSATGMTARNMAIVWAPNLLREPRPHRALQGVAVQAVVTEFLICYAEELFSEDQQPTNVSPALQPSQRLNCETQIGIEIRPSDTIGRRPKSLPLATPTKLLSLEEARSRGGNNQSSGVAQSSGVPIPDVELRPTVNKEPKYIEVGGGPNNLPQYHTVIELPLQGLLSSKRGLKRSPSRWRGLFFRAKYQRPPQQASMSASPAQHHRPQISSPFALNGSSLETTQSLRILDCSPKAGVLFPLSSRATAASVGSGLASIETSTAEQQNVLRPVKSCESLQSESDVLCPLTAPGSNAHNSSKQHSRSASCDSYFEPWQMELAGMRLRLSPQERDGNLFSEEDDTITITRKPERCDNPGAVPQPTSSDTSAEQSPKRGDRLQDKQVETVLARKEAEIGAADRKRTRLEDQLLDILYIDCCTPEHSKIADPKTEQDPLDSRMKGSPEKRHSDTYEESLNFKVRTESDSSIVSGNTDAKRICKNGQLSTANTPAAESPTSATINVKLRERGSPRKQKISSIRYSGLHNPINLNQDSQSTKPQGKIVKIVNQLDQNVSRSSWHGLSQGNSHSTLIKIDWTGDHPLTNTEASSPGTPVTPIYDLLESESEHSDRLSVTDRHSFSCSNTKVKSCECGPNCNKGAENALVDISKEENEGLNLNSLDSFERSNTTSPTNISYQALNRLSVLSAASSNSTDKDQYQGKEAQERNHQSDDYEPIGLDTAALTILSHRKEGSLAMDKPKDIKIDLLGQTSFNSGYSPSKEDDVYECFNFARPDYINLQSSPSSKSSPVSPFNLKSPIRSTISITYKSPTHKDRSYENVDPSINVESESVYEDISPSLDFIPIVEKKNLNDDLIILESPEYPRIPNIETIHNSLDLYSQVKCFRKSVHEVNALLEVSDVNGSKEVSTVNTRTENPYENLEFNDNSLRNTYENVPVGKILSPLKTFCSDRSVLGRDVKYADLNILESPKLDDESILDNLEKTPVEKMQIDEVSETTIVDPALNQIDISKLRRSSPSQKLIGAKLTLNISKETLANNNGNSTDKSKTISNLNVRKLAHRFESPTEPKSTFVFQKSPENKTSSLERSKKDASFERIKALSLCEGRNRDVNRKVPCIRARCNRLSKNSVNTRSLDENAFEKEFGSTAYSDRRKSLEAGMKPNTTALPDLNLNTDRDVDKENDRSNLKLNLNIRRSPFKSDDRGSPGECEMRFVSITPTTENKISLVQARFSPKREAKCKLTSVRSKEDMSCEPISLDGGLTSLVEEFDRSKLSRERIERYKEERRNFLREKYSSQSFRGANEINQSLAVAMKIKKREDDISDCEVQLRHPEKLDRLLFKDVFRRTDVANSGPKLERRNTTDAGNHTKCNSFSVKGAKSPETEPLVADEAPNFAEIARKFSMDTAKPRKMDDFSNRMAISWDLSSDRKQTSLPFIRSDIVEHVKKEQTYIKFPSRKSGVGDQKSPVSESKSNIFSSSEKLPDKRSPSFNIKDVTAMFEQKSNVKN